MTPWLGLRYPSFEDLEVYAESLGAGVILTRASSACFVPGSTPSIMIPSRAGILESHWLLAHEIGHLVQHSGPKGDLAYSRDEWQANRWAACALIPEARIHLHHNACPDVFIGALSAHYEDLPLRDCPQRRLAGKIAKIRIKALEVCA